MKRILFALGIFTAFSTTAFAALTTGPKTFTCPNGPLQSPGFKLPGGNGFAMEGETTAQYTFVKAFIDAPTKRLRCFYTVGNHTIALVKMVQAPEACKITGTMTIECTKEFP